MENSLYAVIDTNVLVSALIATKKESHPLTVLANVFAGTITPLFNDEIISEYRDVLSREKFHLDPADIEDAINAFLRYGLNLERTEVKGEVFPDPKDVVFYEVKSSCGHSGRDGGHLERKPLTDRIVSANTETYT